MSDPNKKTGLYVVRQRDTQIYSYISNKRELKQQKRARAPMMTDALNAVMRIFLIIFSAVLTAYLIFQCYPKESNSWLALFALAPFFVGLRATKSLWGAIFYGGFTGFLTYLFLFYWIYYTCMAGGVEPGMSMLALSGLALVMSLQFTVFSAMCFYARRYGYLFPLTVACGWVSVEFLHMFLAQHFIGFPWFMLGYSQWNNPLMLQSATFGGVFAVSFLAAFISGAVGAGLTMRHWGERVVPLLLGAAMFGAFYLYGREHLHSPLPTPVRTLKVSVLQPNIDQYKKWDSAFVKDIEKTLIEQLSVAAEYAPDIIVWPETALPGPAQSERYAGWLEAVAKGTGAYQLVGSTLTADDVNFVSAYLFSPEGKLDSVYNKEHLVPFGEYVPLKERLKNLNIEPLGLLGSFTPGNPAQPLQQIYDVKFGTGICYESVFPALWRKQAVNGAQIFFNITNDGWYLDTSAPYQHFAANVVRAVETGRTVVRSANTGISGWIDARGNIRASSKLGDQTVMNFEVPVYGHGETFYTTYGNVFAYICIVIFLNISFAAFVVSNE